MVAAIYLLVAGLSKNRVSAEKDFPQGLIAVASAEEIFLLDPQTGQTWELIKTPIQRGEEVDLRDVTWSPDASKIGVTKVFLDNERFQMTLTIFDFATGRSWRFEVEGPFTWLADSETIYLEQSNSVYRLNLETSETKLVLADLGEYGGWIISPLDETLIYSQDEDGDQPTKIRQGDKERIIPAEKLSLISIGGSFSSDNRFALIGFGYEFSDFAVFELPSFTWQILPHNEEMEHWYAKLSVEGRQIVSEQRGGTYADSAEEVSTPSSGNLHWWQFEEGQGWQKIRSTPVIPNVYDQWPCFSPDGQKVAFIREQQAEDGSIDKSSIFLWNNQGINLLQSLSARPHLIDWSPRPLDKNILQHLPFSDAARAEEEEEDLGDFLQKHPLIKDLPFASSEFNIELPDENDVYEITIFGELNRPKQYPAYLEQLKKNKQLALQWIKDKGVDPNSLIIHWEPEEVTKF
ncbi:hypothetical protein HY373_02355 [Candidatus Berkelbacteria bacterium]|nr:hypothetical protein [Candidatus Berkelbacteria bacterium]